jgi:hypothetical protein
MATLTPIGAGIVGTLVTPITPGTDSIPAGAYSNIIFVARSVSTGAPTITFDDPTSVAPAGTGVTFNPDAQLVLTAGQLKTMILPTGRFKDANGNINYTTATPGDAVVFAIGI